MHTNKEYAYYARTREVPEYVVLYFRQFYFGTAYIRTSSYSSTGDAASSSSSSSTTTTTTTATAVKVSACTTHPLVANQLTTQR